MPSTLKIHINRHSRESKKNSVRIGSNNNEKSDRYLFFTGRMETTHDAVDEVEATHILELYNFHIRSNNNNTNLFLLL